MGGNAGVLCCKSQTSFLSALERPSLRLCRWVSAPLSVKVPASACPNSVPCLGPSAPPHKCSAEQGIRFWQHSWDFGGHSTVDNSAATRTGQRRPALQGQNLPGPLVWVTEGEEQAQSSILALPRRRYGWRGSRGNGEWAGAACASAGALCAAERAGGQHACAPRLQEEGLCVRSWSGCSAQLGLPCVAGQGAGQAGSAAPSPRRAGGKGGGGVSGPRSGLSGRAGWVCFCVLLPGLAALPPHPLASCSRLGTASSCSPPPAPTPSGLCGAVLQTAEEARCAFKESRLLAVTHFWLSARKIAPARPTEKKTNNFSFVCGVTFHCPPPPVLSRFKC